MLAAARKYKRVVQVGMQRRSTPHLVDARDRVIREGQARHGRAGRDLLLLPHAGDRRIRPTRQPPDNLDYEMWTGPAPMRPYNSLVHPRSWRAFMEYGNGIVGDMCVHMLDMVRWMLDLGMPARISSAGGILIDKASKANITDSQTATFDFGNLQVVWTHRSYGDAPDPKYPWGATFYGDKGTLKAGVMGYDFMPSAQERPADARGCDLRAGSVPGGSDRKGSGDATSRPAMRGAHEELPRVHRVASEAGVGHRAGIHVGDGLHSRQPVDEAGAIAAVGSREGCGRGRCRGEPAAAPSVSRAVGASGPCVGLNQVALVATDPSRRSGDQDVTVFHWLLLGDAVLIAADILQRNRVLSDVRFLVTHEAGLGEITSGARRHWVW